MILCSCLALYAVGPWCVSILLSVCESEICCQSAQLMCMNVYCTGPHKIDVTYEGLRVPNSPFTAGVVPGCDPSKVKVYGPGMQNYTLSHHTDHSHKHSNSNTAATISQVYFHRHRQKFFLQEPKCRGAQIEMPKSSRGKGIPPRG